MTTTATIQAGTSVIQLASGPRPSRVVILLATVQVTGVVHYGYLRYQIGGDSYEVSVLAI